MSNSTQPAVTGPAAKFIGRPSRQCPKCKSIRHWVNPMGGIECVSCKPPPISLTDLAGRKIIAVAGIWEHDDGQANAADALADRLASESRLTGSVSRNSLDGFDVRSVFVDSDASGAILTNSDTGELIFQRPFVGRWLHDEQELVDWFLDWTDTPKFTEAVARLQGQRLSKWEVVNDAYKFLTDWREQLLLGPSGPRNCYGGLISDLRQLYQWLMENPEQPQDVASFIAVSDLLAGLSFTL